MLRRGGLSRAGAQDLFSDFIKELAQKEKVEKRKKRQGQMNFFRQELLVLTALQLLCRAVPF